MGITMSDGQLAVLRSLPEVACIASPGERIDGVKCAPGHYLVQFWPLLVHNKQYARWELGVPLIFDFNTEARSDEGTSFMSKDNHFSRVVYCLSPDAQHQHRLLFGPNVFSSGAERKTDERGEYYEYSTGEHVYSGAVCRGDVAFSFDPFPAILMMRLWLVQTVSGTGYHSSSRDSSYPRKWWKEEGKKWLKKWPLAQCILVPTEEKVTRYLRLEAQWAEKMAKEKTQNVLEIGEARKEELSASV